MHSWLILTRWLKTSPLSSCFANCYFLSSHPQLPVGAGFSWHADWPRTHHRFLHRSDARRHRRSHPRQCFGGWPQEALQKAECIWKCISQQVDDWWPHSHFQIMVFIGVYSELSIQAQRERPREHKWESTPQLYIPLWLNFPPLTGQGFLC